jgi:hypothetical protein
MARLTLHVEHPGAIAGGKGFLGNEFVRKMELEAGN